MTPAQQAALDKWAEICDERAAIEEFLDWASREGLCQARWSFSRNDVLDRYYGINARDLEAARRALLEEARKS